MKIEIQKHRRESIKGAIEQGTQAKVRWGSAEGRAAIGRGGKGGYVALERISNGHWAVGGRIGADGWSGKGAYKRRTYAPSFGVAFTSVDDAVAVFIGAAREMARGECSLLADCLAVSANGRGVDVPLMRL